MKAERALLFASLLFCAWLDTRALLLVLFVATSDFLISGRIASAARARVRARLLGASVLIDVGLLLAWPAARLSTDLVERLRDAPFPASDPVKALLPAGASFLILRSLGFVIDVYRGSAAPCATWTRYASFLSFFPAFLAGPISRGSQLLPQLERGIALRWSGFVEGAGIFVQGLAKKMLIADRLATIADPVFAAPALYPPWTVAAGLLAYSFQIYCDFAGYTDMAVGVARVLGVELPRNFEMPYLAKDIGEFWRRWHITLSTWLRDYVFLPVAYAGSRQVDKLGLSRRQGELLNYTAASVLTMLVAGAWHGAGWGFVLWGGAHGCALAAHKVWQGAGRYRRRMPAWLGGVLTFVFVSLSWVPFRTASLADAGRFYASLLGLGAGRTYAWFPCWLPICVGAIVLGHLATLWASGHGPDALKAAGDRLASLLGLSVAQRPSAGAYLAVTRATVPGAYFVTLLLLSIFLFAPSKVGPFVYAAF